MNISMRCPHHADDCPHPRDGSPAEVEFTMRHEMVDWLSPSQLADTGLKAVIADTFGSYADKREVEVSVSPLRDGEVIDHSTNRSELWFDYIADLGDGFDPTYAMAYLLAKDVLEVKGVDRPLPHGEFVVLGGDQVYPTANRDAYQNQFLGPYRAALPWRPKEKTRQIFAIPGNHDWYDGLNSFLRIFCQARDAEGRRARWIGAWQARQRRSYFAIKLPGNWWVWGIDGQLESDMDKPQLEYFEDVGDAIKNPEQHKVILFTPEPNWVYCGVEGASKCSLVDEPKFDTLAHFEKRYIREKGLRLAAVVSGDLHHYVHYTSDDKPARHRITSGGGGAYLLATHQMPRCIRVREGVREKVALDEKKFTYSLAGENALYPRASTSKLQSLGIVALAVRNWTLGLLIGAIYLLFSWALQTASRANDMVEPSLLDKLAEPFDWSKQWRLLWKAFLYSPGSVIFALVVIAALWAFTYSQRKISPKILWWIGAVHGVLHVVAAMALMWLIARTFARPECSKFVSVFLGIVVAGAFAVFLIAPRRIRRRMNLPIAIVIGLVIEAAGIGAWYAAGMHLPNVPTPVDGSLWFSPLLIVSMLFLGWYVSSVIFAGFLWITSTLTGGHTGEVFSSMAIENYKHFLRFHVLADGSLRIYPIGVKNVPNKWKFNKDRKCGEPFFEPVDRTIEPEIIDGPIDI